MRVIIVILFFLTSCSSTKITSSSKLNTLQCDSVDLSTDNSYKDTSKVYCNSFTLQDNNLCSLSGHVLDSGSNKPLKNVVVTLKGQSPNEVYADTTDNEGKFIITGTINAKPIGDFYPGQPALTITSSPYRCMTINFIPPNGITELTIKLSKN